MTGLRLVLSGAVFLVFCYNLGAYATCNNKCRERQVRMNCETSRCNKYEDKTCLVCPGIHFGDGVCEEFEAGSLNPCIPTMITTNFFLVPCYSNCNCNPVPAPETPLKSVEGYQNGDATYIGPIQRWICDDLGEA